MFFRYDSSGGPPDSFNDKQLKTLQAFGTILIILLFANVIFMIYNVIQFLLPLKVRSLKLHLFYILSMIMTIARTVELFYFTLTPHQVKPNLTKGDELGQLLASNIGTIANVAIGCLFVATMYDISYSIKILNNPEQINLSQAERHKKIVYAIAIMFSVIFGLCCFFTTTIFLGPQTCNFICLITAYTILSIVYTWTLIQLSKAMKGLLAD